VGAVSQHSPFRSTAVKTTGLSALGCPQLIFQIEDLRNDLPRFVRGAVSLEQFRHRRLPASVDIGTGDLFLCLGKIVGLGVADQEAVLA
jgi:hypothetical protein